MKSDRNSLKMRHFYIAYNLCTFACINSFSNCSTFYKTPIRISRSFRHLDMRFGLWEGYEFFFMFQPFLSDCIILYEFLWTDITLPPSESSYVDSLHYFKQFNLKHKKYCIMHSNRSTFWFDVVYHKCYFFTAYKSWINGYN